MDGPARRALERRLPSSVDRALGRITGRDVEDAQLVGDLELGELEELAVQAEGILVGEEKNDEGPILFIACDPQTVLLLFGQWLFDPYVVPKTLPPNACFASFVLLRAPLSGIAIRLEPQGDATVAAERVVPAKALWPLAQLEGSVETHLFRGSLNTLESSLAQLANSSEFAKRI